MRQDGFLRERVAAVPRDRHPEHADDAREALTAWDGKDHPGGPRIKGGGIDPAEPNARLLSLPRHDSRMIDGLP